MHAARLESDLLAAGVRVFHSDRFLAGAGASGDYLRIALSSTGSLDELERGLRILQGNLQGGA